MESYSVNAILSVTDKNFTKTMNSAVSSLSDLDSSTSSSSKSIVSFASAFAIAEKAVDAVASALKNSLSDAISRVDTLNQYPKVMEQIGFTSEEAEASISKLSDGIDGLPTSLDSIVSSTQSIALLTGDLDLATDTALALNDAFYASGASTADAERGLTQYCQMLSSGTVDMQSWRTLCETMGYALNEVAESFGYAGSSAKNDLYAALQSGEITFDELNERFIELDTAVGGFAEVAQTASVGIGTSMQNLSTAVVKGMANVIQAIDDALEANGMPTIAEQINSAKDTINTAFSAIETGATGLVNVLSFVADNFNVVVAATGPLVVSLTALKVIDTVKTKFSDFKSAGEAAAETLRSVRDASKLAQEAIEAKSTALDAAEAAEQMHEKAVEASNAAIEARTKATNLATKASQAENKAKKTATSAAEANEKAVKKEASAQEALERATEKAAAAEEESANATKASVEAAAAKNTAVTKLNSAEAAREKATEKAAEAEEQSAIAANLAAKAAEAEAEALKLEAEAAEAEATAKTFSEAASTAAATASERSAAAATAEATATQAGNTAITTKNALLAVLTGQMKATEAAQIAWNAAMSANPIGTVITVATTLVGVLGGVVTALDNAGVFENTLWKKTSKLTDATDELVESLDESAEAYEDNISSIKSNNAAIDDTLDSILELADVEEKSAEQKAEMQSLVGALNSSMEDLNLAYDEEADALSMTTDLLQAKAEAYKLQQEGEAYLERYNELLQEQSEIEDQLSEAQELYNSTQEQMNEMMQYGGDSSLYYSWQLWKQQSALEDLEEEQASAQEQLDEITAQMTECYEEQAAAVAEATALEEQALAESIANQTASLEDLSEANQETVSTLKGTWQEYTDAATEMFDTLSDEITLSAQDMIDNIQKNQEVVSTWGDNMESLRDRFATLGLDVSILDQLADLGVDGAGYIAALVQASDSELTTLATEFSEGGEIAKTALLQSLGVDSNEIPEAVQSMITETEASMRETIENTEWSSLGESITSGTAEGISENAEQVSSAASDMAADSRTAAGEAVGEGSPATAFIELGENMIAGLVQGLGETTSVEEAASNVAAKAVNAVKMAFDNADFASIGANAFKGIETSASNSMDNVISTVSSASESVNSEWSAGLNEMHGTTSDLMEKTDSAMSEKLEAINSTTTEKMENITETVESAMTASSEAVESGTEKMKSAMSSGLQNVQKSAVTACDNIISAFSSLTDNMYTIGENAMVGLNNGLVAKSSTVMSTAQQIANNVVNTINSALRIGSPSKVLMQTGEWAGLGLAEGLEDTIPEVEKIGTELAEAMIPAEVADFNGLSFKTAFSGEYTVTTDSEGIETENIMSLLREIKEFLQSDNRTYHINTTLDVDGREFAFATVEDTGEALARRGQTNGNIRRRW